MENTTTIDYVITTTKGCIPYITDTKKSFLSKKIKVYLDDFLYKDSFYDKNTKYPIKNFISAEEEVIVGFKGKPTPLISKRGHYKLTKEKYKETLALMGANTYAEYDTGKIFFDKTEIIEPADLDSFNLLLQSESNGSLIVGTQFINDLVEKSMILYCKKMDGAKIELSAKHLNDTEHEYQKYLLSINEMNAFAFVSETNYKNFHDFVKIVNTKP